MDMSLSRVGQRHGRPAADVQVAGPLKPDADGRGLGGTDRGERELRVHAGQEIAGHVDHAEKFLFVANRQRAVLERGAAIDLTQARTSGSVAWSSPTTKAVVNVPPPTEGPD